MCRHLAYLGPPTTLAALLLEPPHGLLRQSYAPRTCAAAARSTPTGSARLVRRRPRSDAASRYRSARPHLVGRRRSPTLAPRATAAAGVLAAVRSATVGMPVTAAAAAPFAEGRWLFSHNGVVRGWPDGGGGARRRRCRSRTCSPWTPPPTPRCCGRWCATGCARATTRPTCSPTSSLGSPPRRPGSRLNLLLTDGAAIWATTWDHALSVRAGPGARPRRVRAARRRSRRGPASPTDTSWWPAPASTTRSPWGAHRELASESSTESAACSTSTSPTTTPRPRCARTSARADGAPEELPPKCFYDARGSELFEEITALPEYYPTRTERGAARGRTSTRSPRSPGPTRWSSWARARRRRPGCCSTRSRRAGGAAPLRAAGRQRGGVAGGDGRAARASTRGSRCTAWSATSPATSTGCPRGGPAAWSRSSAARSATCAPARAGRVPHRAARRAAAGGAAAAGRGMVMDPPTLVAAYDDARASRPSSTATSCACSTGSCSPTSPSTRSPTSRCGTPSHEWIEMRLRAAPGDGRARGRPRPHGAVRRGGGDRARRSRRSSGPAGCGGGWRPPATRSPAPGPIPWVATR